MSGTDRFERQERPESPFEFDDSNVVRGATKLGVVKPDGQVKMFARKSRSINLKDES